MSLLNPQLVGQWITYLHGGSSGLIHINSPLSWAGRTFPASDIANAVSYVTDLDVQRPAGIYLRCTTIREDVMLEPGQRGSADQTAAMPGLWSDIDLAGPGHKHTPNRPDLPDYNPTKPIRHPLPPDLATVGQILGAAGIPAPTTALDSGGGIYAWWMFDQPLQVAGDEWGLDYAKDLSEAWQQLLTDAFALAGYHYGNVGDLARVLKPAGTVNYKIKDQPRPCQPTTIRGGPRYPTTSLDDIRANLGRDLRQRAEEQLAQLRPTPARPMSAPPATPSQPPNHWAPAPPATITTAGLSPLDDYENRTDWAEILEPAGWRMHRHGPGICRYWTRPDKDRHDGWSATTGQDPTRDRMFVFSTATDLPAQQCMTKGFVYAQLHHGGDLSAAAKTLHDHGYGSRGQDQPALILAPEPVTQPTPPAVGDPPAPQPDPAGAAGYTWLPPKPLADEATCPEFPIDLLPERMRRAAATIASTDQVAVEAAALSMIGVVSGLVAHHTQVGLSEYGWYEPPVINTMSLLKTGERKSPGMKKVAAPVWNTQKRLNQRHAADCEDQITAKAAERGSGAQASGYLANRLEDEIKKLEESKEQGAPRILVGGDTTAEALVGVLHRNGGHGLILDAEASILSTLVSGRYSKGTKPNLDILLNGYDGQPHASERVGRGHQLIERPIVTMALSLQPGELQTVLADPYAIRKGFVARFLFAKPKSKAGTRFLGKGRGPAPLNVTALRDWASLVDQLAALPPPPKDTTGFGSDLYTMHLSPEAKIRFIDHHDLIEARLGPDGDLSAPGIVEWASKHNGRILRLAALLHLADGGDPNAEISDPTMVAAIGVGTWALAQAVEVLRPAADEADHATGDEVEQLLRGLRRKGTGSRGLTIRDIKRSVVRAAWATQAKVADALDILAEHGYTVKVAAPDRGNRMRERWVLNPLA